MLCNCISWTFKFEWALSRPLYNYSMAITSKILNTLWPRLSGHVETGTYPDKWFVRIWEYFLTLKGPGFFVYFKSGGGGGFRPPPQISAAERRKILKFGTYVE